MNSNKVNAAAKAYLELPNTVIRALGGASHLRETVSAGQFKVLHSWPSFCELPFGISFQFRTNNRRYIASFRTSAVEPDRYCLEIYCARYCINEIGESELTLDVAVVQFFEFAQAVSPD